MTLDEALNNNDYRSIVLDVIYKYNKSPNLNKKWLVDIAIWKALSKYNESHSSKAEFKTYLWHVAKNLCLKENKQEFNPHLEMIPDNLVLTDNNHNLFVLLESLDELHKSIIYDKYFNRMTLKEIGEKYHFSIETARRKIQEGLRLISQ